MTTANGFCAIIGQGQPIRLLKSFIANDRLPHALLFSGDDGIGKKMTALAFAMAVNCHTLQKENLHHLSIDDIDACGNCASCRKIAGNQHPDIIHIQPRSSIITISQIRTMLEILALKPHEAAQRVVILSEAQAMNPQAANALLKVLEEPPRKTLLVLTANQPSNLLPTVASRCRHIRFFPLDQKAICHLLRKEEGSRPEAIELTAGLFGGSFTRAKRWAKGPWPKHRDWLIRAITDRIIEGDASHIRYWLALSEKLAKKKEHIEESLEIVTMWLRDALVINVDPKRVVNRDRMETLAALACRLEPAQLLLMIEAVDRTSALLRSNTNTRLTLDAMVLHMASTCAQIDLKNEEKSGSPVQDRR